MALTGKPAAETTRESIQLLEPLKDRAWTIKADSGKEFAWCAEVAAGLDLDYHFARQHLARVEGVPEPVAGESGGGAGAAEQPGVHGMGPGMSRR